MWGGATVAALSTESHWRRCLIFSTTIQPPLLRRLSVLLLSPCPDWYTMVVKSLTFFSLPFSSFFCSIWKKSRLQNLGHKSVRACSSLITGCHHTQTPLLNSINWHFHLQGKGANHEWCPPFFLASCTIKYNAISPFNVRQRLLLCASEAMHN